MVDVNYVRNYCDSSKKRLEAARAGRLAEADTELNIINGISAGHYDSAIPSRELPSFKSNVEVFMNDFGKFISARQEHISKKVRVPWNQEKETLGDYLKKVVQVRGVEMVKIGQEMTTADREFLSANLTPWTNLLERQHKLEKQLLAWLEKPK